MKLKTFKELDMFGQEIKWRLLSKDNFKSFYGALITLNLLVIFAVKIYFFVQKAIDFGFAKNKFTNQFRNEFQFLNMSDFELVIITDLESKIEGFESKHSIKINDNISFNLGDFLEIKNKNEDAFKENYRELKITEIDCEKSEIIPILETYKEAIPSYKCLNFLEGYETLNITKNDTLKKDANGNPSKIHANPLSAFTIQIDMKEPLINFLNLTKSSFKIEVNYLTYRLNAQNFELEKSVRKFKMIVDPIYRTKGNIIFRKLSVTKKIEFDIFETEISDHQMYEIDDSLLKFQDKLREKDAYYDILNFYIDFFESYNEVTLLTFDDIMATLGGFLQIFLTLSEFIVSGYNQRLAQRVLSNYCMEKYTNYDKTLGHVRNNIYMQMDYYSKCRKNKRTEKEIDNDENHDKDDHKNSGNISDSKNQKFRKSNILYTDNSINADCFKVNEEKKSNIINNNFNSFVKARREANQNNKEGDGHTRVNRNDENLSSIYKNNKKNQKNEILIDIKNKMSYFEVDRSQSTDRKIMADKNLDNYDEETTNIKNSVNTEANKIELSLKNAKEFKIIVKQGDIDKANYHTISKDADKCSNDKNNFPKAHLYSDPNTYYSPKTSKGREKLNLNNKTKDENHQEWNKEDFPMKKNIGEDELKEKQEDKVPENASAIFLLQNNAIFDNNNNNNNSNSINNNHDDFQIIPKTKRRRKYFEPEFDFMEFVSIERYMNLLSGFEAFKFYFFNDLNRFNFDCLADLSIFSENYNLKNKDKRFFLTEQSIPIDNKQEKIFERFLMYIKQL